MLSYKEIILLQSVVRVAGLDASTREQSQFVELAQAILRRERQALAAIDRGYEENQNVLSISETGAD
jgi:hypothetical protein